MFDVKQYEDKLKNIKINDSFLCQNMSEEVYIAMNNNTTYKNNKNYLVINGEYAGGTIVLFPKDIVFTWYTKRNMTNEILGDIINFFAERDVPIYGSSNDIMIDGKKLLGTTSSEYKDGYYEGLFFSFDPDKEIIRSICQKEMKKEPIGLSTYNILPEDIIELCKKIINKYNLKEV